MSATTVKTLNLRGLFEKVAAGNVTEEAVKLLMSNLIEATRAEKPYLAEINSLIFRLSTRLHDYHHDRVWYVHGKIFEPRDPEWDAIRLLMEIADLGENKESRFQIKTSKFDTFSELEKYEKKAYEFIVLKIFRTITEALKDESDRNGRRLQRYPLFLPLIEWLGSKENQLGHPKGVENIGLFLAQMTDRFWGKWHVKRCEYRFPWFEPVLARITEDLKITFEQAEKQFFESLARACVIYLSNAQCDELFFNLAEGGFDEILPVLADAIFPGHGQTVLAKILEGGKIDYLPHTSEFSANLFWIFQKRALRVIERKKSQN
ncbi:MAG: hypothetical protein PHZ04_04515 [Patescibacteria group bacterium]|nr:hypothetical protein [Patescibacteria group bacterium]MDD5294398.1 hypothetical protein [Patescibacteria group bacterium]MDD5554827.1 hypothetical protein [Patescibacteria group bacterium]